MPAKITAQKRIERGRAACLSYDHFQFAVVLKPAMMLANHFVLKDICFHPVCVCQSFLPNIIPKTFLFTSLFSAVGCYSLIRSLATAHSQHAVCLTPKRYFVFQQCARRRLEAVILPK